MLTKNVLKTMFIGVFCFCSLSSFAFGANLIINGSFEDVPWDSDPVWAGKSFQLFNEGQVPGWQTSASDDLIEIWESGMLGIPAAVGNKFAEVNAKETSALFQTVSGIDAGSFLGFEFAHRGRDGVDTLRLTITDLGADNSLGGGDDTILFTNDYSTGNNEWVTYSSEGEASMMALGNTIQFSYEALNTASGKINQGNFLDAIAFTAEKPVPEVTVKPEETPVSAVPEPSTVLLLGVGLVGLIGLTRRGKK